VPQHFNLQSYINPHSVQLDMSQKELVIQ